MSDKCNPNPCKHSGICKQNSNEFFCDCTNTGYSGAVCHIRKYKLSIYLSDNTFFRLFKYKLHRFLKFSFQKIFYL